MRLPSTALALLILSAPLTAADNRLTYLDDVDPYYVSRTFPKLVTPQWVGEDGVEAVVILAIDDMRGHEKWEAFLRPILERLKRIDGRAPVSIMTCQIDPKDPHLQKWLKEGLSLETHTIDHPCPLLQGGNFAKAKSTYDRCVDLLNEVPNSKPVAFRVPCCDSLNTPSPRFYAEIFNKTTPKGNFLQIDSSVFNVVTSNDPDLPRELVIDPDGRDRFLKYLPTDRTFVNTIENYPYPYVIGRLCWEFPCVTPSDWLANHHHKPNNPITVRDWKAALDAIVIKKGVFCLVFHPHGWVKSEQIVELIDHAVAKHGKKVKFLTFREALERLNEHHLRVPPLPLRDPKTGLAKWPAMLLSVDECPGYLLPEMRVELASADLYFGSKGKEQAVFIWKKGQIRKAPYLLPPGACLPEPGQDHGLRFIDIDEDGQPDVVFSDEREYGIYLFTDMEHGWSRKVMAGKAGEPGALPPIALNGKNNGFFVHSRSLWWQNENTNLLKDHVDRRSFNELLANVEPGARPQAAALQSIQTRPGFQVELVAAEPLIEDPIAFAWGPDGKLWVVEMRDYPLGMDGKGKPGGRIVVLESTKGDGKYDKSTVFLDDLPFPTGVMPWRKGVIVTCAPDIFYAEDTDGDGKANKKIVLYTGFVPGNQQHRVNGPVWGLDNWIYVGNGDSGGRVRSVNALLASRERQEASRERKRPEVNISGRDLRFRPDDGSLDAATGQTQYGRSRDDWGNWFGNNNSNPMYHYVLADHYLRRNPHVAAPDPRVQVSVTPGAARVYPISRTLPRFNDPGAANHFTSACSAIVYRDELFYAPVADAPGSPQFTFVSEPVHNLVHRELMTPEGVTFRSRRAPDEQESEFLASSDNWFRPTQIQTGPDGALWIADMYRAVIEHPQWIPADWQKRLDLRAGSDKGRIYRVYPVGTKPRPIPRLDRLATAGLVAALDSPNGWQRDMAQQMLLWRNDKAAVRLLEKQAAESKRPHCRLHALCTLDGLGDLKAAVLLRGLADSHPGVRRHAVRLCEGRFAESPDLGPALLKLVADPDVQVRLQLAYTLGEWDDARAGEGLGLLAVKGGGDRYLLAAILSSVNRKNLDPTLQRVLAAGSGDEGQRAALLGQLLRLANAFGDTGATVTLLNAVATPQEGRFAPWQFAALAELLDTLDQRNSSLAKLRQTDDAKLQAAVGRLEDLFTAARAIAVDEKAPHADRVRAIRLLGRGVQHQADERRILADLLVPQTPTDLQAAVVAALGRLRDPQVPALLLRGWKGYLPGLRTQVLDVLLVRDDWLRAVLDAAEAKQILPMEIDPARRQRLVQHRSSAVRERAAKLFAGSVNPDRQKVVEAHRSVLSLKGDSTRGRQLFTKTCAACHQLAGIGQAVGPDLASVGDKSPEGLLIAILDPNRAVEARYVAYLAETKDGRTLTGLLASETGTSITLVSADGKQEVILRTDLETLSSTGKSAMPEGLEKDLKPQDLADVIAFVRAATPAAKPKVQAGNKPELVRPDGDGVLHLLPSNAEIYGKTLVLEKQYGNLGYWSSDDDRAVWSLEVTKAGKYIVSLDYACDDGSAGNTYVLEMGGHRLTGKVAGTGTWDAYRRATVGEVTLSAGRHQAVFRAEGKIRGALIDLREVRLVPASVR
jgi:putative membrane-bound dehydrogenase-like protein